MSELFDIDQAAAYLNMKPRTLRSWVAQGYIPYVRLGPGGRGRLRFKRESLERWVNEQEAK